MPILRINNALIYCTNKPNLTNLRNSGDIVLNNKPVITNGNPRPSPYMISRVVPRKSVSCWLDQNKIILKTGPTHGVHTSANVIPIRNAP